MLYSTLFVIVVLVASSSGLSMSGLKVNGIHIQNGGGTNLLFKGVERGTAATCVTDGSFLTGPTDNSSIQAMLGWNITAVKIPINEACFFGIRNVSFGGAQYFTALYNYVTLLTQNNLAVILSLSTSNGLAGNSTAAATYIGPMPASAYASTLWANLSSTFNAANGFSNVMYELYDQPWPNNNEDDEYAWGCWVNGGSYCNESYTVVGMQSLVTLIRSHATNPIMIPGVSHGNSISQWPTNNSTNYVQDPRHNIIASLHVSDDSDMQECSTTTCWITAVATLQASYPVLFGSVTETDCASSLLNSVSNYCFSGSHHAGLIAAFWEVSACANGALVMDYAGTPSTYGTDYYTYVPASS